MRTFLIAVTALATAAPLAAQQPVPSAAAPSAGPEEYESVRPPLPDPRDEEIHRNLPDPREMQAMGDVAARAIDAIMDTPIGPLREAIEGRRLSRREREETLGDQARRDDPYFRERMRDQIGMATVALGALSQQMAAVTPVLRRTLEDVERRMEEAVRTAPPRDYPPR